VQADGCIPKEIKGDTMFVRLFVVLALVAPLSAFSNATPNTTVTTEIACKRQLICDEGEVCRARIRFLVLQMSFAGRTLVASPGVRLEVDAKSGMVRAITDFQSLDLFQADLAQLNCRENDLNFRSYPKQLSELAGWEMEIVQAAPQCRENWAGKDPASVREVKFGLFHESHSVPAFTTDTVTIPCDIPQ